MIEIQGKLINTNKVVSIEYKHSDKNQKHYVILLLDVLNEKQNKMFFEVENEQAGKALLAGVKTFFNA